MLSVESPTTYYTMTRKYHDRYEPLEKDIEADVVVIGGGFSGVNIALELAERGITNTVVLEANYLGFGGSGRNGGHVMAGIGHDLGKIRKYVGDEGVKAIFNISDQGASTIQRRIDRYGIDADFRRGYGYLAFNGRQGKLLQQWEKEFKELNPGEDIAYLEGAELKSILGSDAYCAGLMHMGNGHIHSLNLLLGEARTVVELGGRIYEHTPVVEVTYGKKIKVRTARGSVTADKVCFACGAFINRLEPKLDKTIISTYSFQLVTEPLSDDLIQRISPIRGAFTDVRPAIDYYRVTNENRLLFGTVTHFLEYIPKNFKEFNRNAMLRIFPYLKDVKIDLGWGGPMECSATLFPQIGTLPGQPNAFFVQGYSGFGVTPSHVVSRVVVDGMLEGSYEWDVMSSIPRARVIGKENFRNVICTLGKVTHQLHGYVNGRR